MKPLLAPNSVALFRLSNGVRYSSPWLHRNQQSGAIRHFIILPLAFIGLLTVLLIALAAITYRPAAATVSTEKLVAGSAPKTLSPELQATFDRSCAVCHSQPATGAPATGSAKAWQPRLSQGMETLLQHTQAGYKTMPPMGLCIECNQAEFVAFIEHMAGVDSGMECAE